MKLQGKIAVVAGASGGIGREISRALAKEGVEVILVARNKEALTVLKEDIELKGGKAHIFVADLTKPASVDDLVREISKRFNHIDILFNAMGIGVYKKLEEIQLEEWEKSLSVNVTAVFLLTQKLLALLKNSKKALVISMGSGMGKIAVAGRSPYCASKFALRGLMLSLGKEYKKTTIQFALLTVGSVMTAFGPLTVKKKKVKESEGKQYLDPEWFAKHVVTKIKHDTLDVETPVYPSHYFEESKKGKT